jgi:hypothetical protein
VVPDAIRPINRQQPPPVESVAAMTALGRGEPLDADYPQSASAFGPARRVNGVRIDLDLIRQKRWRAPISGKSSASPIGPE